MRKWHSEQSDDEIYFGEMDNYGFQNNLWWTTKRQGGDPSDELRPVFVKRAEIETVIIETVIAEHRDDGAKNILRRMLNKGRS